MVNCNVDSDWQTGNQTGGEHSPGHTCAYNSLHPVGPVHCLRMRITGELMVVMRQRADPIISSAGDKLGKQVDDTEEPSNQWLASA